MRATATNMEVNSEHKPRKAMPSPAPTDPFLAASKLLVSMMNAIKPQLGAQLLVVRRKGNFTSV